MNKWRSPTAEKIYARHQLVNTRSCGTSKKARRTISGDDIKWADVILVMEDKHQQQLRSRFPGEVAFTEIHVLDIPDEYRYMDPELVQCIEDAVGELLAD
ncbi:phosphotyrosine protein phosphatase [bacterium]|nr:phosphotyrosine protein phosphatase [bacterium]